MYIQPCCSVPFLSSEQTSAFLFVWLANPLHLMISLSQHLYQMFCLSFSALLCVISSLLNQPEGTVGSEEHRETSS